MNRCAWRAATAALWLAMLLAGCGRESPQPTAASAAAAAPAPDVAGVPMDSSKGPEHLQLVGLHRPDRGAGLREGIRHQGQLRRVRFQRGRSKPSCWPGIPATTWSCPRHRSCSARYRPAYSRSSTSRCCPISRTSIRRSRRSSRCTTRAISTASITSGALPGWATTRPRIAAGHAKRAGGQSGHVLRPQRGQELQGLRRLDPRCARMKWSAPC
jgi:hypothetical protein